MILTEQRVVCVGGETEGKPEAETPGTFREIKLKWVQVRQQTALWGFEAF